MKKVIVISGGSQGLGKAIAKELSSKHTVIILARTEKTLQAAAQELGCIGLPCDVTNEESVTRTVRHIIDTHKGIDCVINNAGVWTTGPLEEMSLKDIRESLEVNVLGTILLTRAVLPHMKAKRNGLVININSLAGLSAKKERTIYNTSKWAITGFTRCLQEEVSADNIRVTGIHPGKMKTDIFAKAGVKGMDFGNALEPEAVARVVSLVVETDAPVLFPEISIKHIAQ